MQLDEVKLMSFNVNGLENSIKRSKVIADLKKGVCNFFARTHLSCQEHEKLKRYGFKNTYYNSYVQSHRRGIVILVTNEMKFEYIKK